MAGAVPETRAPGWGCSPFLRTRREEVKLFVAILGAEIVQQLGMVVVVVVWKWKCCQTREEEAVLTLTVAVPVVQSMKRSAR